MLLVAPLIRGHPSLHRIDVFAAALPGGLSAYFAGGGSTHDYLLDSRASDPLGSRCALVVVLFVIVDLSPR